jgi:hypothetical protein
MEILKENTNRGGRAENYHNSPTPHSNILRGTHRRQVNHACVVRRANVTLHAIKTALFSRLPFARRD